MMRIQTIISLCLLVYVTSLCHVDCQPLRIGAFNIQVFGQKKAANPDVMRKLVKIIRRYDLLLIQEIRDSKKTAIFKLLKQVNEKLPVDKKFEMVVSSRLGRTVSKEQYAYMYRPGSGLTIDRMLEFDDGNESLNTGKEYKDLFQREPFMIQVTCPYTVPRTFVIIGIHVAPEQAVQEINALEGVFAYVRNKMAVPNSVVMGDLNADCSYVNGKEMKNEILLRHNPDYTWLISDDMDTTVKHTHCAYDRFIFNGDDWTHGVDPKTADVYEYDSDPQYIGEMTFKMAKLVSDHYPIEFLLRKSEAKVGLDIRLCGVYVTLKPNKRLEENKVYLLDGTSVLETFGETNPNPVQIGSLRESDVKLQIALLKVQYSMPNVLIEVMRERRKYGGQQKAKIAFHVEFQDIETVKNILKYELKKFKCT